MGKKIITVLLLFCIVGRIGWLVHTNRNKYSPDYWKRYPSLKNVYNQSQYIMKNWKYWIPDETGYSYAAGAYIQNASPILVESTQPPLGKYILGLSVILTGNENIAIIFFYIALMSGVFFLTLSMTRNYIVALFAVTGSVFERLFSDQLIYMPLLDIIQVTFLCYAILSASRAVEYKKPVLLLLTYIFFGAAMMTKVWIVAFVIALPLTVILFLIRPKYYLYIIGGFLSILIMIILSYSRLFADHYSVIQILKVQKWLFWYHTSKINRFFTIWPLIFLNRWYVWWGNNPVIYDTHWSLSWPVSIGSGLIASFLVLRQRIKIANTALLFSAITVISYSLFISFGQATARYILPVLPFCYALSANLLYTIMKRVRILRKVL